MLISKNIYEVLKQPPIPPWVSIKIILLFLNQSIKKNRLTADLDVQGVPKGMKRF